MLIYALQRVGLALLICLTSLCLLFTALHVIPGDPATCHRCALEAPDEGHPLPGGWKEGGGG